MTPALPLQQVQSWCFTTKASKLSLWSHKIASSIARQPLATEVRTKQYNLNLYDCVVVTHPDVIHWVKQIFMPISDEKDIVLGEFLCDAEKAWTLLLFFPPSPHECWRSGTEWHPSSFQIFMHVHWICEEQRVRTVSAASPIIRTGDPGYYYKPIRIQ